jgi:hypothetical protein
MGLPSASTSTLPHLQVAIIGEAVAEMPAESFAIGTKDDTRRLVALTASCFRFGVDPFG